jgi:predicted transposase/invertase (TIGR01784 family)
MRRKGPFGINPLVDCVFLALFGDPERPGILLAFLNAVIAPGIPIVRVLLRNPRQGPAFVGDDLSVLDVEATDAEGRIYQVEMQNRSHGSLRARMLYNWASLYEKQLVEGDPWQKLRPVICIWVLNENILKRAPDVHHCFTPSDMGAKITLSHHLQIHTLELEKWRRRRAAAPESIGKWLRCLTEAENWEEVPKELSTPDMEEAMDVLERFAKNAAWNSAYRARVEYRRNEISREYERDQLARERDEALVVIEQERAAKEQERAAKEQALAAKEQERAARLEAEAELVRLRAHLNTDPGY